MSVRVIISSDQSDTSSGLLLAFWVTSLLGAGQVRRYYGLCRPGRQAFRSSSLFRSDQSDQTGFSGSFSQAPSLSSVPAHHWPWVSGFVRQGQPRPNQLPATLSGPQALPIHVHHWPPDRPPPPGHQALSPDFTGLRPRTPAPSGLRTSAFHFFLVTSLVTFRLSGPLPSSSLVQGRGRLQSARRARRLRHFQAQVTSGQAFVVHFRPRQTSLWPALVARVLQAITSGPRSSLITRQASDIWPVRPVRGHRVIVTSTSGTSLAPYFFGLSSLRHQTRLVSGALHHLTDSCLLVSHLALLTIFLIIWPSSLHFTSSSSSSLLDLLTLAFIIF